MHVVGHGRFKRLDSMFNGSVDRPTGWASGIERINPTEPAAGVEMAPTGWVTSPNCCAGVIGTASGLTWPRLNGVTNAVVTSRGGGTKTTGEPDWLAP